MKTVFDTRHCLSPIAAGIRFDTLGIYAMQRTRAGSFMLTLPSSPVVRSFRIEPLVGLAERRLPQDHLRLHAAYERG